jgi:N-carbamoylputrescine amidase
MRNVTVSAIQMSCNASREENIEKADRMVRHAAQQGANIILLPELFETPYFCQEKRYGYYSLAAPLSENPAVLALQKTAKECHVVLPVSFYEKAGMSLYNSAAIIDADGTILGIYRKSHIPDDHFYQEKFYFTPGDTGFRVFQTAFGTIGVGICWDQWFPEAARSMALLGAEILLYPTAIGSEPILECDSMPHWRRCMQGHAASNLVPLLAANRIGTELVEPCEENNHQSSSLLFYGSSFIADQTGAIISDASRTKEEVLLHTFDLDEAYEMRMSWGVFRDRRPELYQVISTPPFSNNYNQF